jgi:SEC-C motif
MHWHERDQERWGIEQRVAKDLLDDCRSGIGEDGVAFVEGVFHVRSQHGHRYESVTLRVEYPPSFPQRGTTPKVVLVSHRERWQREADAHINTDWSLCLFVPGESGIDFRQAESLNALFAVVQTFLFKEHLYQQDLANGKLIGQKAAWPGDVRSHGLVGIAEFVRDKGRIGRNEACPCGSGKKFKVCCMRRIMR